MTAVFKNAERFEQSWVASNNKYADLLMLTHLDFEDGVGMGGGVRIT